jgi:uncharacterized Zn finger protein
MISGTGVFCKNCGLEMEFLEEHCTETNTMYTCKCGTLANKSIYCEYIVFSLPSGIRLII